jgi:multisubunit Na+/H+ antiporter MnhB subunit
MFARILTSLAGVVFSLGLLFYGMGGAYRPVNEGLKTLGLWMGIGGLIALAIGIVLYRQSEDALEAEARAKLGPES